MTPVRKYIQANATSGGLRADVRHRDHPKYHPGHPDGPAVIVELAVSGTPMLTADALKDFTEEVVQVAKEEVREHGGSV